MIKKPEELWITNISRTQDISVGDLRIRLRRGQSINLLAKKKNGRSRYEITRAAIDKSIASGSIFKKSHVIKIRQVAPIVFNHRIDINEVTDRSSSRLTRTAAEIEVVDFPDLEIDDDVSEEEFAAENADADFADRAPVLAVDPKFKKPTVDDE